MTESKVLPLLIYHVSSFLRRIEVVSIENSLTCDGVCACNCQNSSSRNLPSNPSATANFWGPRHLAKITTWITFSSHRNVLG